jgi:chromosome segregation ATPase
MRRALGLQPTSPQPGAVAPPSAPGGPHRPARRFVRDGEVAVSMVRHDAAAGTNQLEAARQVVQSQTTAREQAERRLAEAQEIIRELQTQLAHERLARDEAGQRADAEKQAAGQALASLQAELLTVRETLQQPERRL